MGAAGSTQTPDKYLPQSDDKSAKESQEDYKKSHNLNNNEEESSSRSTEPRHAVKLKRKSLRKDDQQQQQQQQQEEEEEEVFSTKIRRKSESKDNKKRRKSFEENMEEFNNNVNGLVTYKELSEDKRIDSSKAMVENFLDQQVIQISENVVKRKEMLIPSLSEPSLQVDDNNSNTSTGHGIFSKSLKTGAKLPSANSSLTLRGMAKRHHARQHNAYINANSLVQVSSFLNSFSSKINDSNDNSVMSKKSSLGSGVKLDKIEETKDSPEKKPPSGIAIPPPLKLDISPAAELPANNMKKKMGLNLKIQVHDDEDDWIQVLYYIYNSFLVFLLIISF